MITVFAEYLYWHFTVASFEILKIAGNYLKSVGHQFLIVQHFKTLFSPWHRQNPSDFGKGQKSFSGRMTDSVAYIYVRLIAAGIRLSIIFMGLLWQATLLVGFGLLFIIWLSWPAVAIYSI